MSENLEQKSPEWFAKRVGLVTGSSVGAILGLDPYREPRDVLRQMVRSHHKAEPEFTGNVATEYGNFHEDGAIIEFAMVTRFNVEPIGFCAHESGWLGASPDGIVNDGLEGRSVLEVKCPYRMRDPLGDTEHKSLDDYPHYYAQIQIELMCANAQRCYFWQWASHQTRLEIIPRNNEWLTANLPALKTFHELFLSEIDNPEHLKPLRKEVDNQLVAKLLSEYDEVCDQLDFASTRKQEIINELVRIADGRDALLCGRKFTKIERAGSVSYAQIVKHFCPTVNLEPYRSKPSVSWRLT